MNLLSTLERFNAPPVRRSFREGGTLSRLLLFPPGCNRYTVTTAGTIGFFCGPQPLQFSLVAVTALQPNKHRHFRSFPTVTFREMALQPLQSRPKRLSTLRASCNLGTNGGTLPRALSRNYAIQKGSAIVSVAPVGVPPTGPTAVNGSLKSYLPLRPTISTMRLKTLRGTPKPSKPTAWFRLSDSFSRFREKVLGQEHRRMTEAKCLTPRTRRAPGNALIPHPWNSARPGGLGGRRSGRSF